MPAGFRTNGLSQRSYVLLLVTIGIGLLHHSDHVLRVDHSGWPFTANVTAFTFSLLAYPILLFALLGSARLFWMRWSLLATGLAFTLIAHTMIESPQMQYAMWAHNRSLEPQFADVRNLLGLQSAAMGSVAVVLSMTLNLLLVASTLTMLADGRRASERTA